MPKFLIEASYRVDGVKGVMKDGGSGRRSAAQKAVESVGGKLEAFYFTFGDHDAILIADVPDVTAIMALSLAVNGSGAVKARTTPLISVEEVDAAVKKTVGYRAPGA